MIRGALQAGQPESDSGEGIRITRPSMRRPFIALVLRLDTTRSWLGNEGPAVAVLISNSDEQAEIADPNLSIYGLTPSEARVAHLLLQGNSLEEAALKLKITGQTARTHLKRIFSKTDTRRQGELVRLLLMGPTIVRSG